MMSEVTEVMFTGAQVDEMVEAARQEEREKVQIAIARLTGLIGSADGIKYLASESYGRNQKQYADRLNLLLTVQRLMVAQRGALICKLERRLHSSRQKQARGYHQLMRAYNDLNRRHLEMIASGLEEPVPAT